jgi:hypothetical protein
MFAKILSSLAIKLLTEKVLIKLSLSALDYLVAKTTNKLDDKLLKTVKEALGESE